MAWDFDLFVIGGGSGGVAAAKRAAALGARVGLAEPDRLGGTCVNRGCVPKKLMVYAARFADQWAAAGGYGWSGGDRQFDWPTLMAAVKGEVSRLNQVYATQLDQAGVVRFRHRARFVDNHRLKVGDRPVTAARILIAVGGQPVRPDDIPGIELAITSDEIFQLAQQPRRLVIIGGGYIGSEFACIFNGLGTEVIQLIRSRHVLSGFDDDLRAEVHSAMQRRGIRIVDSLEQVAIAQADAGLTVTVTTAAGREAIPCDGVSLAATGRSPHLAGLGLEHTGVAVKQGAIAVDDHHRTTVPHIFAVGDVTDRINLTPVAIRQGWAVAEAEFGGRPQALDYGTVPTAVFTTPELATVGLTETQARTQWGDDVHTHCTRFRPLYYALTDRDAHTLIKLVVQTSSDRVLGVHLVGDHAAEIVQGAAIAVTMGATKADFDATVAIHPTIAEELVTLR